MNKTHIVIVDPLSTGALYAQAFAELGFACICVLSRGDLGHCIMSDLRQQDFVAVLPLQTGVVDELKQFGVHAVVAGCETAIHAADRLADQLGCLGNSVLTSDRRRHKDVMQTALAGAGLPHIPSRRLGDPAQIDPLVAHLPAGSYVIKPINSAATDGVHVASGPGRVRELLQSAAWGQLNDLRERNLGFIVQPFITGPEYVVDMVAAGAEFAVASVCRYEKIARNGGQFVYRGLDVLDPRAVDLVPLIAYAKSAAAALDIRIGPVHMELIWSPQGPVMIEAGARLHGGVAPQLFAQCYEPHLLELATQAYVHGNLNGVPAAARLVRPGRIVFLITDEAHEFTGVPDDTMRALAALPSYQGHKQFHQPGEWRPLTVDFATCPGIVWLSHEDPRQMLADEQRCRELLQHRELAPPPTNPWPQGCRSSQHESIAGDAGP